MKATEERIAVMQAFEAGYDIDYIETTNSDDTWTNCGVPAWNWIKFDYRIRPKEPEIDWSKVAIDTPVLIDGNKPAYFAGLSITGSGKPCIFDGGRTSRCEGVTASINSKDLTLDLEAKSIINWIPNTGEKPNCKIVIVKRFNGHILCYEPSFFNFKLDRTDGLNIKFYAIIE